MITERMTDRLKSPVSESVNGRERNENGRNQEKMKKLRTSYKPSIKRKI